MHIVQRQSAPTVLPDCPMSLPIRRSAPCCSIFRRVTANYNGLTISLQRRLVRGPHFQSELHLEPCSGRCFQRRRLQRTIWHLPDRSEYPNAAESLQHSSQLRKLGLRRPPLRQRKFRVQRYVPPRRIQMGPQSGLWRLDAFQQLVLAQRDAVHGGTTSAPPARFPDTITMATFSLRRSAMFLRAAPAPSIPLASAPPNSPPAPALQELQPASGVLPAMRSTVRISSIWTSR